MNLNIIQLMSQFIMKIYENKVYSEPFDFFLPFKKEYKTTFFQTLVSWEPK